MFNKLWGRLSSSQKTSGKDFKGYFAPPSLTQALQIMCKLGEDIKVLAGGTDLLVQHFEHLDQVQGWLDLSRVDELQKIEVQDDRIEIGAMVTHQRLEKSAEINSYLPLLSRAAAEIGSPQIRSRGTIGGNIVNASPAGDLLPALLAYGAEIELLATSGRKILSLAEFFTGPKQTIICNDQLLTKIMVPLPQERTYGSWIKVGRRKALIISSINLAVVVNLTEDKQVQSARVCMGSVAPTSLEISEVSREMVGKKFAELDFISLGKLVSEKISPIDDIRGSKEYRKDVAARIMVRALEEIKEEVGQDENHPEG